MSIHHLKRPHSFPSSFASVFKLASQTLRRFICRQTSPEDPHCELLVRTNLLGGPENRFWKCRAATYRIPDRINLQIELWIRDWPAGIRVQMPKPLGRWLRSSPHAPRLVLTRFENRHRHTASFAEWHCIEPPVWQGAEHGHCGPRPRGKPRIAQSLRRYRQAVRSPRPLRSGSASSPADFASSICPARTRSTARTASFCRCPESVLPNSFSEAWRASVKRFSIRSR